MDHLEKNKQGGIEDHSRLALERAKKVDLITFPKGIVGTNCFNCSFIRNKGKDIGYCYNPDINQYVNGRMCCNLWHERGTLRAWEKK
jgi:hypothetical protein